MTPEKGHGVPTPPPVTSLPITPRVPSPATLGHATNPKKGTADALHLEILSVGTAGNKYELLTVMVPTVHAPVMVRMET